MATVTTRDEKTRDAVRSRLPNCLKSLFSFGRKDSGQDQQQVIQAVSLRYSSNGSHGTTRISRGFPQKTGFAIDPAQSCDLADRVRMNEPRVIFAHARLIRVSEDGEHVTLRIGHRRHTVRFGEPFDFTIGVFHTCGGFSCRGVVSRIQ